jgi:hypothetical protein
MASLASVCRPQTAAALVRMWDDCQPVPVTSVPGAGDEPPRARLPPDVAALLAERGGLACDDGAKWSAGPGIAIECGRFVANWGAWEELDGVEISVAPRPAMRGKGAHDLLLPGLPAGALPQAVVLLGNNSFGVVVGYEASAGRGRCRVWVVPQQSLDASSVREPGSARPRTVFRPVPTYPLTNLWRLLASPTTPPRARAPCPPAFL